MAVDVLDDRYLAITAIITVGWQFSFWIIAAVFKFDKVTDLAYGANFVVLSITTLILNDTYYLRQVVVTCLVSAWGARLAVFLFGRIIKIGHDARFDSVRENPLKFLIWFSLQMVVVWLTSWTFVLLNSSKRNPSISAQDVVGWVIWGIGFFFEAVGDHQKFMFKSKPDNRDHWCDVGLWKVSRHPNYFGEICCWWGIFISACVVFNQVSEWVSIIGPILLTLMLIFGTGIPPTEKSADKRFWDQMEYRKWKNRTPVLVPFIPGIIMGTAKTILCCEFPFFSSPPDTAQL